MATKTQIDLANIWKAGDEPLTPEMIEALVGNLTYEEKAKHINLIEGLKRGDQPISQEIAEALVGDLTDEEKARRLALAQNPSYEP